MNENVFLFGGGLDTMAYCALQPTAYDVLLYVDYGARAGPAEWECCKRMAKLMSTHTRLVSTRYVKADIARLVPNQLCGSGDQPFIKGRNLQLLNHACMLYPNARSITFGFCDPGYEAFPDANQQFIDTADALVHMCYQPNPLRVKADYLQTLRTNVLRQAVDLLFKQGGSAKVNAYLDASFTCWTPVIEEGYFGHSVSVECGECRHCLLKKKFIFECSIRSDVCVTHKISSVAYLNHKGLL